MVLRKNFKEGVTSLNARPLKMKRCTRAVASQPWIMWRHYERRVELKVVHALVMGCHLASHTKVQEHRRRFSKLLAGGGGSRQQL